MEVLATEVGSITAEGSKTPQIRKRFELLSLGRHRFIPLVVMAERPQRDPRPFTGSLNTCMQRIHPAIITSNKECPVHRRGR